MSGVDKVKVYYEDAEGRLVEVQGEVDELNIYYPEGDLNFTMSDLWQTNDPPRDGYYIVTIGNVIGIAIWEGGKWWESPHETTEEVIAWMPVPKPARRE